MPFLIKQGDRRPYITGQILLSDEVTPLNLSTATSLSIVMRKKGSTSTTTLAPTPYLKSLMTITNASLGQWSYAWQAGDTREAGSYDMEIEILWSGAEAQTVPVLGYYEVIIVDDIG